ncbi:MAG TPA: contractile injection system protein, VgrG/Pvc8 family [Pyrinomonadaceae bacterium]|nr:contractile injection system protein, VgrG/Pvc8 family [Pyrinomonadaceae bacterium]
MPAAQYGNPLVAGFDVSVNGSPIPVEAQAHVTAVTVEDDTEWPSMFTVELATSVEQDDPLVWVDNSLFAVGGSVEIKLGYGDAPELVLAGEITGLEPQFSLSQLPLLVVRGYDRRHRLTRGRKTRSFLQQKDSDIAAQIAGEAGLSAEATDSQVTHDYVLQANQSDMEFLRERAGRIHFEVALSGKTLYFRPVPFDQGEALTLTNEGDLLEFHPRLTSAFTLSEVAVRGWSPKEKKEIVGQARMGDETATMGGESGPAVAEGAFGAAPGLIGDRPVMSQAEADQVAKARYNDAALGFISGEGICHGRADLRSGRVVKIEGVGRRFSGNYFVTSARHHYTPRRGYYTYFNVRRNAS